MRRSMKHTVVALQDETAVGVQSAVFGESHASRQIANDPMRRFVPCPHVAHLPVAGRTVRLETNSLKLLDHMVELFACYPTTPHKSPEFLWRLVVESDSRCCPPWPRRSTFSEEGTRFAQFGQRNFLAVDLDAHEAIGFVSEGLFEDAHGFISPFIDTFFYMTVGALGLVPFTAACVLSGANALLVLGAPNQGKTTASYLAARDGLTLHSDQSVFLEIVNSELRAWADFVPLSFRPDTLHHLPELKSRTRPFSYCDFRFYYMPKNLNSADQSSHATPSCCVVLERGRSSVPCMEALDASELFRCLCEHIPFKDDCRFEEQQQQVVAALARLPAYRLAYDSNPATAAPFFQTLLNKHAAQPRKD